MNFNRLKNILKNIGSDLLAFFGALSLFASIVSLFPALHKIDLLLKEINFFLIFFLLLIIAIVKNIPKNYFEKRIDNKDVHIALKIGNITKERKSIVVPINDEFDVKLGGNTMKSNSIKSQIINKFFDGDLNSLQTKINSKLKDNFYTSFRIQKCYKMGTTVRIENNNRIFYFVVNSKKDSNSKRVRANEEELIPTLNELWSYLSTRGSKDEIAIPLLGTGNGRLSTKREDVFKTIVRSFISSCAEQSYCKKLILVISPKDMREYEINIEELKDFLTWECKFASPIPRDNSVSGKSLSS